MPTSSNRLRRKLAEIFRIEVLEVRLQRVSVEGTAPGTGLDRAFTGVDGRELEQCLARQDRRLESQRQRDRIGGAGIDLNDRIAPIDMQLGEVGVVLHLRDDHLAQLGAQPDDHLLEQIVRQRAREFDACQLHRDRAGLRRSDPDRQDALSVVLLQNHDRRVCRAIQPEVSYPNLQHGSPRAAHQVPISQEARYFRCAAVRVSIATPIACSLRRAISWSRSAGMRWTSFDSCFALSTTYSAASAWFANDMSMTLAGWPSAAARLIRRPSPSTKSFLPSSWNSSTNSRAATGPLATFFNPSRSISTLKCPEFATTAPSFIARMCSTLRTSTLPVIVTNKSPIGAAASIGMTR